MSQSSRRNFLQTSAGAIAAMASAGGASPQAPQSRPNLVFLMADQLRYFSCGYAGDEYARTPQIDRLASESCNFHQAISSTPLCAPYRASLLTGKYQSSTGMVINELRLSPEHECLGNVLTSHGYQTAMIGKWHLWANQLGHHDLTRNGFVPPGPYRLGFDHFWAAYNFNHEYFASPYFLDTPERQTYNQYEPDAQTDRAIAFMRSQTGRANPFALFLAWGPPHEPWNWKNVPPEYADRFRGIRLPLRPNYSEVQDPYADDWAKLPGNYSTLIQQHQQIYYAQTASIDTNVGRIVKALDEAGLAENTILVFTSDHGEMFGAHGRHAKNTFYEEAARIPWLLRWPGHVKAGRVTDAPLGTPDVMPTLLSMLGLPIPHAVEGADLSAYALTDKVPVSEAAYMQGMGTTAAWADGTEWRAMRDLEYTYAIYRRDRRELLFNHRRDPYQLADLAGDRRNAGILDHYRRQMQDWLKQRNDTFEACTWYRDHWTMDRNIVRTATDVTQNLDELKKILSHWYPTRG